MPISKILHFIMILAVMGIVLISVASARIAARRNRLKSNLQAQAILMAFLWSGYNIYYFMPSHFTWYASLPLQVCDILGPVAAMAITLANRLTRSLLYFCGIVLAGQALATPAGDQNPVHLRFWLYWALHAGIIALWTVDVVVLRYRPTIRDFGCVLGVDMSYALAIVPLDIYFHWNYGYLGKEKPGVATVVDYLGPWPWRIATTLVAVAILQALMLFPWICNARLRHGGAREDGR